TTRLWIRVGMAMKRELGDDGYGLFEEWSQQAESFNAKDALAAWKSFRADGKVTVGTVLFEARKHGFGTGIPRAMRARPTTPAAPRKTVLDKNPTDAYALALWQAADRNDAFVAAHPYCQRKGIQHAFGAARGLASGSLLGQNVDCILIPIREHGVGEVIAVQAINSAGRKQTFGTIGDGFMLLGDERNTSSIWHAVEGWATGCSVRKAKKCSVALISFGKGRLQKVADLAWELYRPTGIIPHPEVDQ
ncbi:MAG: PriCT-2 domain-containing protein, partial [Betaproteobacteria bacterium]|nr:PriCT-2 domain-containing protein [Candidatus Proximibacter danicus]